MPQHGPRLACLVLWPVTALEATTIRGCLHCRHMRLHCCICSAMPGCFFCYWSLKQILQLQCAMSKYSRPVDCAKPSNAGSRECPNITVSGACRRANTLNPNPGPLCSTGARCQYRTLGGEMTAARKFDSRHTTSPVDTLLRQSTHCYASRHTT